MTAYESTKELFFLGTLSPWQSHSMTIFVSTVIGGIVVLYAINRKKQRDTTYRSPSLETDMRHDTLSLQHAVKAPFSSPVSDIMFSGLLRALGVGIVLLAVALSVYSLWQQAESQKRHRMETIGTSADRSLQIANLVAERVKTELHNIELIMQHVRAVYRTDGIDAVANIANASLLSFAQREVLGLSIIDTNGKILFASDSDHNSLPFNLETHLRYAYTNTEDKLFVGQPVKVLEGSQWQFVISIPLRERNEITGLVTATVSPDFIVSTLKVGGMDSLDVVTLYLDDGAYLARSDANSLALGRFAPSDSPFLAQYSPRSGTFKAVSAIDGVSRIIAWQRIDDLPLIVSAGLGEQSLLAPFERDANLERNRAIASSALLIALSIAFAALLNRLALRQQMLVDQTHKLEERERDFRTLTENLPDIVARFDRAGRPLYMNPSMLDLIGIQIDETVESNSSTLFPEDRFGDFQHILTDSINSRRDHRTEQSVVTSDGTDRFFRMLLVQEQGTYGFPQSVLLIGHDVTDLHRKENELRLAATVFHNSAEGVLITDAFGTIESVNPAFTHITGYEADDAIGRNPRILRSNHHDEAFFSAFWTSLTSTGSWQGEIWNRRKNGEVYLQWMTVNSVPAIAGNGVRYVAVFHDITDSWTENDRMKHLAFHDALTGLPNRALLQERLEHAIQRCERDRTRLGVMLLDLDGFKMVNDSLGHDIGDLLLKAVVARIETCVRRGSDTVARLGGDEFIVLTEELSTNEACATLASQIIGEIAKPFELNGNTINVGVSLGIAVYPENGINAAELIKHADIAMYAAKTDGKGTYRFFAIEIGASR